MRFDCPRARLAANFNRMFQDKLSWRQLTGKLQQLHGAFEGTCATYNFRKPRSLRVRSCQRRLVENSIQRLC